MSERVGKMLRHQPQLKRDWPNMTGRERGRVAGVLRENRQTVIMKRIHDKATAAFKEQR